MARIVRFLGMTMLAGAALGVAGAPHAHACDLVTSVVGSCRPEEPPEEQEAPPARQGEQPPDPGVVRQAADRLLELVNRDRAAAGLPALAWRDDVRVIAEEHSARMADAGTIWHNDEYFTAQTRQRLGARSLGENVALNPDVDDAHRRLMASEGHRANILSPRFDAVGIGVVRDSDGRYFVTQGFLESAAPAPAPSSAPAAPAASSSPATVMPPPPQAPAADGRAGSDPGATQERAAPGALAARGVTLRLPADPPAARSGTAGVRRSTVATAPVGGSALAAGLGVVALLAAAGIAATLQRRALAPA